MRRALCMLLCGTWICAVIQEAEAGPGPATNSAGIVRAPVESSSLVSIGFAREAQILEIEFRSGAIYQYLGVAQVVFDDLKKAKSKGRYFAQSIRGKYPFHRLEAVSK